MTFMASLLARHADEVPPHSGATCSAPASIVVVDAVEPLAKSRKMFYLNNIQTNYPLRKAPVLTKNVTDRLEKIFCFDFFSTLKTPPSLTDKLHR